MYLSVDEELFAIETLSSRTQFLQNKPPERPPKPTVLHSAGDERSHIDDYMELCNKRRYTFYSDDEEAGGFHLFFSKCLSASAAARQLGRRRILGEEHKQFILNYIDENPSAVVTEVVESLLQNFCNLSIKQAQFQPLERNNEEKIQQRYDWVQKWQQTDLDFTTNCVFLDESAFHINLKRGMTWSRKGTPAVVTVPMTKAKATSILGAISATGLISVSLRVPKRIKKGSLATLDEMDKYPEMKGHYLVMDNAPIHSSADIRKYIYSRGYRCVYLPPYSPELNPIEQF
ncbi:hypothetical protein G6F46_008467 [Rhizopus delemar]|uniref:Tc1-like transposase DDE domain-containing protein n=2 Tax=Rhizopus TaxID=4842 RepID=A0A9P6YYT4_9FUNG|nr:hypothetical protein G6F55_007426 [Rhizopus delemar]KAG1540047.1 hypothetical protein G6F51_008763 [Rhizopus arrhizus]KAG1494301.1 hypothetical protein G6F54_007971 [Rhizopus delemar]KAG1508390.1 hypothetical protein G6F53_008228 [Rhizopus delemar]KAG1523869.1 hypothetical protein G6F52_004665 [Rhizopus delemar]